MIDAYLTDTITLISHTGNDQWGEPSTPAESSVKARVEFGFKNVRDATGAEVVASGMVLMVEQVRPGMDKLRIDGVERQILAANPVRSFGVSHWEVAIS